PAPTDGSADARCASPTPRARAPPRPPRSPRTAPAAPTPIAARGATRRGSWLPAPAPQDERHVHLVGLVVEAGGIHRQVDAEAERQLALLLAARVHLVLPLPEVVARPRAAEVVLAIDERGAPVVQHALQVRRRQHPPRR